MDRGAAGEGWDGVRNHQASNNMKAMEIGDLVFFYHSVNEKQIVGIAEVSSALSSRSNRCQRPVWHGHDSGGKTDGGSGDACANQI